MYPQELKKNKIVIPQILIHEYCLDQCVSMPAPINMLNTKII